MKTIEQILNEPGRSWTGAAPASEFEIKALERALGSGLPTEYVELLRSFNGGEGELAVSPFWFQLFDTKFAASLATDVFYRREFPGLFFFGSNGGLESLGFDMQRPSPWPIVAIDCVAGPESRVPVSDNLLEFIQAIGLSPEQFAAREKTI